MFPLHMHDLVLAQHRIRLEVGDLDEITIFFASQLKYHEGSVEEGLSLDQQSYIICI